MNILESYVNKINYNDEYEKLYIARKNLKKEFDKKMLEINTEISNSIKKIFKEENFKDKSMNYYKAHLAELACDIAFCSAAKANKRERIIGHYEYINYYDLSFYFDLDPTSLMSEIIKKDDIPRILMEEIEHEVSHFYSYGINVNLEKKAYHFMDFTEVINDYWYFKKGYEDLIDAHFEFFKENKKEINEILNNYFIK